jgi:hypothetical protein
MISLPRSIRYSSIARLVKMREERHRVAGLILRHRGDLHPRRRMLHPKGLPGRNAPLVTLVGDPAEPAGADELEGAPGGNQRVLAPALQPLDHAVAPQEPVRCRVHGVPPQRQPGLFGVYCHDLPT